MIYPDFSNNKDRVLAAYLLLCGFRRKFLIEILKDLRIMIMDNVFAGNLCMSRNVPN